MRFLGLDYGTKRIGVALSNPEGTFAIPLETIAFNPDGSHVHAIRNIVDAYHVDRIVVGLPYNMDGSIGSRAEEALKWGKELEGLLGLSVDFWDERLSTSEAHGMLMNINMKGKKRKTVVDKIAASIILQGYLDSVKP